MTNYIRLLIVGDIATAKHHAAQRGIKVRSAANTGFYTALYVDEHYTNQIAEWFCAPPREAPFPDGTCVFYSPVSKIIYQ